MSVTDLAPAAPADTAQRTVEILDHVLDRVREALARASVVPDLTDAASELRALASAAWEGAEQIEPLAAEHVLNVAEALVDAAATDREPTGREPATSAAPSGPGGEAPALGYQPRHSASTPAVSPWPTPGVDAPSAPVPAGGTIADQLAALDALLSTSEHLLGAARPILPRL